MYLVTTYPTHPSYETSRQSKPCSVEQSTPSTSVSSVPVASTDDAVDDDEEKPHTEMLPMQPARKQTSVQGFIDRMGQDEHDAVNKAFAKWIYSANLPLSVTENPYFCEFAQKVRPAWKYPSLFHLTNKLLDSEVVDADAVKGQAISTANAIVLQSDDWTSVKGKSLINVIWLSVTTHQSILVRLTARPTATLELTSPT
jgi:hypothetical protein